MREFDNHDKWPGYYVDAENPTVGDEQQNQGNFHAIVAIQISALQRKGILTEAEAALALEYSSRSRSIETLSWAMQQSDVRIVEVLNTLLNSEG